MKKQLFSKACAAILSASMLFSTLPACVCTAATASIQATANYGLTRLGTPSFQEVTEETLASMLPDTGEASSFSLFSASKKDTFYSDLQKNLLKRKTGFSITYNGSYKDLPSDPAKMLDTITQMDDASTSDDADFLTGSLLAISYSCSYTASKCVYNFSASYTDTAAQVKKLNTTIKNALKAMSIDSYSDTAKVKLIHDYVVNTVNYDQTLSDHSAYGGLVASKHTTVCQGYALIMYKMLTEAGVKAHYVTGYAGEAHAWNIVKIDKKWYHLDATWDDPISSEPILTYNYFLIGSKTLNKDHTLDSKYKKLYTISSSDLNWKSKIAKSTNQSDTTLKTTQTKKEETASALAKQKHTYIRNLNKELDKELNYTNCSEYEKIIYDLYKDSLGSVIKQMDDAKFKKLNKGNEKILTYIFEQIDKQINKKVLTPVLTYLGTDEFTEDAFNLMLKDYSESQILALSDEQFAALCETYAYSAFRSKLSSYSKKYTESIVKTAVKNVNKKSF